jgi:hypothetical protein
MSKIPSGAIMVVLDDGETWASDGFIRVIADTYKDTNNGSAYPDGDADEIESEHIVADISISDLIAAYNKVHGTDY